ncbi:MAG: PAS domain-containing protein [Alphaproteobacteria bacterium]|nr:PAS domain-containing protein [Alphaproteobacteria bacterium]
MEPVISQEPLKTTGQERRITFRLLSYWNRIRADREMPSLGDVNVDEITEIWHFSFVIDISKGLDEARFHYFGPELVNIFEANHTDELLRHAMEQDTKLENTLGFYPKVVERRAPVSESSEFFLENKEVRYRSLIVPFSGDGKTIDYLMGTTNYKIFD